AAVQAADDAGDDSSKRPSAMVFSFGVDQPAKDQAQDLPATAPDKAPQDGSALYDQMLASARQGAQSSGDYKMPPLPTALYQQNTPPAEPAKQEKATEQSAQRKSTHTADQPEEPDQDK